jgi:hypothetical protein
MPKTLLELRNRPLLDIVSHGRGGPKGSIRLSADQIAAIDRTVRRVPEAMVKVLPKDSNNLRSVTRHLNYIGRYGKLELEPDDGERIQGKDAGERLLEDWDLDLDKHRRDTSLTSVAGRSPKLVHKIMLSMPPGTPANGVLEAARNFAREEFALKHRYALMCTWSSKPSASKASGSTSARQPCANGVANSPATCASKASPRTLPSVRFGERPGRGRATQYIARPCVATPPTPAPAPKPWRQNS